MIENNIETVAASDDQRTIDMEYHRYMASTVSPWANLNAMYASIDDRTWCGKPSWVCAMEVDDASRERVAAAEREDDIRRYEEVVRRAMEAGADPRAIAEALAEEFGEPR
ncbi:hypothetical protein LNAOJCKE_0382 [Methylorubrum aminovorans]|uniref:Uncharacterized protein n=1 Tax=Methylorubrum aminovorans TaxID=269069 RepID=A0ABQ4U9R8_9HYPH|nr:hypothetical protein [Methylorubrum aminovorans]GJE63188.1 hypothetical protein LNAOJCKE_0382 [Methylorubrum aminovorans]GMA79232.1 hypothetical protein GCM10025880_56490 [Methylorubrum aminovorans]